jgi:hypothetical protein
MHGTLVIGGRGYISNMGRDNSNNSAELEEMAEFFNVRAAGFADRQSFGEVKWTT